MVMASTNGLRRRTPHTTTESSQPDIMKKNGDSIKQESPPKYLQLWLNFASLFPEVNVFGVDMGFCLGIAVLMMATRISFEYMLINVFGWPTERTITENAAASAVSLIHSALVSSGMLWNLLAHPFRPAEKLDKSPAWLQKTTHILLQFSSGYMLYDSVNVYQRAIEQGGWEMKHWLFIGHHVASFFYATSARVVGAGHISICMGVFLGECTSPFQNAFHIAREAIRLECCNGPWTQRFFHFIAPFFAVIYLLVRVVTGPAICLYMTFDLWTKGRKHIPVLLLLVYTLSMWGIILGSGPWIRYSWTNLCHYYPFLKELKIF